MATKRMNKDQILKLALAGVFTAIVVVFQFLGSFIKFGTFSVSLVLVPIIIGAALCGPAVSTWLGLVFSAIVLYSDSALFLTISFPGTVITVLLKGTLCGLVAGLVFNELKKVNTTLAVVVSAIAAPVVNTGIFLLGCRLFFFDAIAEMGADLGFTSAYKFMIIGLVGWNFVFELITNIILCPAVVGFVKAITGSRKSK